MISILTLGWFPSNGRKPSERFVRPAFPLLSTANDAPEIPKAKIHSLVAGGGTNHQIPG
jgi:hypothetical protein